MQEHTDNERRGLNPEAPTESFFASLKKELVNCTEFAIREQARSALFYWIEIWYIRKRRHSAIGYMSPDAFERQSTAASQSDHRSTPCI